MIRTLQKKFVLTAMLAITILLLALLGAINIGNAFINESQNERLLEFLINNQMPGMQPPPARGEMPGFLEAPLNENKKMSAVFFTAKIDYDRKIVGIDVSRIASVSEDEAKEIVETVLVNRKSEGITHGFRYKSVDLKTENATIYLFLDTSAASHNVLRILFLSAFIGIICWGAMLLLVVLLSKKAIRPIAENMERQKQFVTDAGHEIKTPLAIILANTEAMELYNGENKWSVNIKEQVNRLSGLMQNLLTLSKADEISAAQKKEQADISELTQQSVDMFRETMELKGLTIEKHIEPYIKRAVNKELFLRLISILTDNAVKYAKNDSNISVRLMKQDKNIYFEITNFCENLPECPADKLFDRFYRADSARTQKSGGYGIGLSAARSIAEAHGGAISAEYREDNGITFKVRI
ncbi:MAG TPA: HAMP domain-containing sensor histidine kinase [Oscillospiraceae bacterium]|nr:HAMP domain-containing sensor histidine kinase [Oscillospiraceae bacterium]